MLGATCPRAKALFFPTLGLCVLDFVSVRRYQHGLSRRIVHKRWDQHVRERVSSARSPHSALPALLHYL